MAATEQISLAETLELLPGSRRKMCKILARLRQLTPVESGTRVLEVGAAQGRGLVELQAQGLEAVGVEPWDEARQVAGQLSKRLGVSLDIRMGVAEELPFADRSFDIVIASSVMEHVTDLKRSLREVHRVLEPGGVFWFNSASAMCPRQNEIRGFPGFGLYPDAVKKRLMRWAAEHRPSMIGYTTAPALHWWTNRTAEIRLRAAGFERVWTRWELRTREEESTLGWAVVRTARRSRRLQRLLDTVIPGCSYAARKGD